MKESFLQQVSIIIPIANGDLSWKELLPCLKSAFGKAEILLVSEQNPLQYETSYLKWIPSPQGRAIQMNTAAKKATREILWFLHADSHFDEMAITQLARNFLNSPNALHYFHLSFHSGSFLMKLNEWGVFLRSSFLKMPFGDQGFAMKKDLFHLLYGYDENAPYGEDHHFVWKCHRFKIPLKRVRASLKTSARKYQGKWLKTTIKHLFLTYKQAWEQMKLLLIPPKKTAIACFVKTPGVSELKTRLAKSIGREKAQEFHSLSCQTLARTLKKVRGQSDSFYPYWSVAEDKARSFDIWKDFFTLSQGGGELGQRLHYSYQTLRQIYQQVLFIGADSPQLSTEIIQKALLALNSHDFVLGPAQDGGYYLFGGKLKLEYEDWLSVPYSTEKTLSVFQSILEKKGSVALLGPLTDVDTIDELKKLKEIIQHKEESSELKIFLSQF